MTGVVLIDELDLHLHPLWQWKLVETIRELFPRLSFVVTTHNPITLLGARAGEVFLLQRNTDGQVVVEQKNLPEGGGAERILTGEWFGLPSTVDRDTLAKLTRHQELMRDPSIEGEAEQAQIEATLKKRLGRFMDNSLERIAASVVAEVLERHVDKMSPAARQSARDRALAELRRVVENAEDE
jgi:predicted ATP-binding protein involved in virulence